MTTFTTTRRRFMEAGGHLSVLGLLAASGISLPAPALAAWNKAAFETKTLADALKALDATGATENGEVQIIASDIAENGAVVPVQVVSKLENTEQIAILVDKNPFTVAAVFDLGPGMIADISTRIKMAQSANVVALVKAGGKFFTAAKDIKVTLGGCGG